MQDTTLYTIALLVFFVTYVFIIMERINRAVLVLLAGTILVFSGVFTLEHALDAYVDWETLILLIGMMLLVGITSKSGVFQYVAIRTVHFTKGSGVRLLVYLSLLTAVCSAFLDNVTTVLLIVPITLSVTRLLHISPIPILISEILFANIGGTATLIGDPPNIMIGTANEELSFNTFLVHLGPAVVIITFVVLAILIGLFRKQLTIEPHRFSEVKQLQAHKFITDVTLVRYSVTVLLLTIVGFILHSWLPFPPPLIALGMAAVLMVLSVQRDEVAELFASVEWVTIFFFIGLFVLVGGLIEVGFVRQLADGVLSVTDGDVFKTASLILWVSGIASAFIDNIPFVATMIPLLQDVIVQTGLPIEKAQVLWWSLALGACLGGNGTIIGASANLVVLGIAEKENYKIHFWSYFKIGFPIMLVTIAISQVYIWVRYFL